MKTKQNFFKKILLASSLAFMGMIALSSCDDDDDNPVDNRAYTISGDASGAQVVPPVTGTGTGAISGSYNPSTRTLTYTSNWNGLSGVPLSGGFYSGATGAAGTTVGDPWVFAAGSTETGSVTNTMTLTAEQSTQLLNGGWYYSYGTTLNPAGEVRGQIIATR